MSRNARLLAAIAITAVALPALAIWHFSADTKIIDRRFEDSKR